MEKETVTKLPKEGINISFVLREDQVDAGLKLKTVDGKEVVLYRGKQEVACFNTATVTVESLRVTAECFKVLSPLMATDPLKEEQENDTNMERQDIRKETLAAMNAASAALPIRI